MQRRLSALHHAHELLEESERITRQELVLYLWPTTTLSIIRSDAASGGHSCTAVSILLLGLDLVPRKIEDLEPEAKSRAGYLFGTSKRSSHIFRFFHRSVSDRIYNREIRSEP